MQTRVIQFDDLEPGDRIILTLRDGRRTTGLFRFFNSVFKQGKPLILFLGQHALPIPAPAIARVEKVLDYAGKGECPCE